MPNAQGPQRLQANESMADGRAWLTFGGQRVPAESVISALAPHVLPERLARLEVTLSERTPDVVLGVENLHHSHNGIACLRTAEAFGLQDVVAVESLNPFPETDSAPTGPGPTGGAHKVTRLTDRWLSVHRIQSAADLTDFARARGLEIWGATPTGASTLAELPVDRPLLAMFGNEKSGLLPETLARCAGTFRIPMTGFVESFNISVSVGIVLHDLMRRRREAGVSGPLDPTRRTALLARWLFDDVRAAHLILERALSLRG